MFESVKKVLIEQLHLEGKEITLDSKIIDDLGADSLDILQLLMTIEEEKGIVIPDEELATFEKVGDMGHSFPQNNEHIHTVLVFYLSDSLSEKLIFFINEYLPYLFYIV